MGVKIIMEYSCHNCKNNTFEILKDEEHSKCYGYDIWKLKCINCGEEIENDKYIYLLNTFFKTQKEIGNIVKEFGENAEILREGVEKLIGIKKSTGELEQILRKLNFIYFEESAEITNSPNTIALLIKSNLPNGVHGAIQNTKGKDKNTGDIVEINLTDDKLNNMGSIKIVRESNNIMNINVRKSGKKRAESMKIDMPFRIIHVLLRINEIFNYTD